MNEPETGLIEVTVRLSITELRPTAKQHAEALERVISGGPDRFYDAIFKTVSEYMDVLRGGDDELSPSVYKLITFDITGRVLEAKMEYDT